MDFRLSIDHMGLAGNAEPSKRFIYLAGAGAGSFILCISILFMISMLDFTIITTSQLERATESKALGILNLIPENNRVIKDIWNNKDGNKDDELYRELLRSLRFELNNKLEEDQSKILGVTSLDSGEGKTFIAYSLAYAFAMTGKKVLLIADEFPVKKSASTELATIETSKRS